MENKAPKAPNAEDAKELVETVLGHYLKHHELVLKKLTIAQEATKISIEKIKEFSTNQNPEELEKVWGDIIEVFKHCGMSEDELFSIEHILDNIPKTVKEQYEKIIQADESISELLKHINKEQYEAAMGEIEKTQSKPNPMSGLTASDYEVKNDNEVDILKDTELQLEEARKWWKPDNAEE